jgi:hypothetical protein
MAGDTRRDSGTITAEGNRAASLWQQQAPALSSARNAGKVYLVYSRSPVMEEYESA